MTSSEIVTAQAAAARRGILVMWTIYDKPSDHPEGFIARMHEISTERTHATDTTITGELEEIRNIFWHAGLLKLSRQPDDQPPIVESWV